MTIASEITRIKTAVADAYTACQEMGATMPAVLNSDNLEQCIASISGGGPTPPQTKKRLVSVADNSDSNKLVLYTDDGITWNTSTMPNSRNWGNVFYGNGKFIVPCYDSNIFAYSTDGINWTEGTLPSSGQWQKGVYGNGIYVLISYENGAIRSSTSTDGINWSSKKRIPYEVNATCGDVVYDGNKFIVIMRVDNAVDCYITSDFQTFTKKGTIRDKDVAYSVIEGSFSYTNNYYCFAFTNSGPSDATTSNQWVYISSDLINWTDAGESTSYNNLNFITSCNLNDSIKIFSGRRRFSTQAAGYINVDSAGTTATYVGSSVPRLNYQGGANILNGKAIVIGYGSDQYIYSTDGTTWSTGTLPASSGWWGSCVGEVTI